MIHVKIFKVILEFITLNHLVYNYWTILLTTFAEINKFIEHL
jgi:hypothetical protein